MQHTQNNLRSYRKKHRLRQKDVARLLRLISHDRISHWEKGAAVPGLDNLLKLCALYKMTPQQLYPADAARAEEEVREKLIENFSDPRLTDN